MAALPLNPDRMGRHARQPASVRPMGGSSRGTSRAVGGSMASEVQMLAALIAVDPDTKGWVSGVHAGAPYGRTAPL